MRGGWSVGLPMEGPWGSWFLMPESISKFKRETFRVTVRSAGPPDGSAFYELFTGCGSLLLAENVHLPATHQNLRWADI